MKKPGETLASFFIDCAKQTMKGGIKSKGAAAMVAMFLDCAQEVLKK